MNCSAYKGEILLNKEKRNDLSTARELLEKTKGIVGMVRDKEQDCLDNIPENLESSERYSTMESAIDSLDDAIDKIEEAQDSIDEAMR